MELLYQGLDLHFVLVALVAGSLEALRRGVDPWDYGLGDGSLDLRILFVAQHEVDCLAAVQVMVVVIGGVFQFFV